MNVNELVHPQGPPRYNNNRVSLPSISNILLDLPTAAPVYPPQEPRNYYLGRSGMAPMTLPPLGSSPGSRESHSPSMLPSPPHHTQSLVQHHHYPPQQPRQHVSGPPPPPPPPPSHATQQAYHPRHHQPLSTSQTAPKRKTRNNLPKETTYTLLKWLNEHLNHPYPNSFEKNQLMHSTGLNQQQLSNWFINARRRKIKVLKKTETH
ncbi:hypothetical protein CAAN1_10S05468 [[Candida] anglica]|uniref:Homeobox domain-containing protein n=1 Tax=[Candida] anglica TaxID=148631 RepID=A0ABP0EFA4_9ASCO